MGIKTKRKRKRDTSVASRKLSPGVYDQTPPVSDASHDVFRRYFEARFLPLDIPARVTDRSAETVEINEDDETADLQSDSEWSGFSDGDEDNKVEVVEYKDSRIALDDAMDKKARKAFMNSKPPCFPAESTTARSKPKQDRDGKAEDKNTDAEDLKNDLALQRLLKESHLLESASELAPSGKNRHRALDLRMQALGSKTSIYAQQNMPSSHRRGIKAKATSKEERRRREARENGIILEKPAFKPKNNSDKRRERGVGGPSVGKFAGGTLKLNKRDLSAIQGTQRTTNGKGKGRR